MLFSLKKLIAAFLMPLSIGLLLGLIGLSYLFFNSYKKAKIYLTISFLWIFFVSSASLSNALLKPLETLHPKIESVENIEYILLLGGDFKGRSFEALRLYYEINNVKIITSGYASSSRKVSEAESTAEKLFKLGIPKEDIFIQSKPRDTQEEASYVSEIVGDNRFILVTAAYHMPRAMEIFKNQGLNPIPAPTNFLSRENTSLFSMPSALNLHRTEIAFHEYLGMLWYRIKGILD